MKLPTRAVGKIFFYSIKHPIKFLFILRVKWNKLTYLGLGALVDLATIVETAEKRNLPGMIIETGCALGGSALVMASAKSKKRSLKIFDTFELIPQPSSMDGPDAQKRYGDIKSGNADGIKGEKYYGYLQNLLERVKQTFSKFGYPIEVNNIILVKGLFDDTLKIEEQIGVAHIDCDWYESVKTCLERIAPKLVIGGTLIIDDYFDWSGCKKAVDEYFSDKKSNYQLIFASRLHITRIH